MTAEKKGGDVWGGASYKLPNPYLRTREDPKDKKEGESAKPRFVTAPGDGAAYKFGNAKRGRFYHINVYGKDIEPPVSYLPVKEWVKKREAKKEETKDDKKAGVPGRGTFIDAIFFYGNKYKYPGPDQYIVGAKNKKEEPKKEGEDKDKKKTERLNFLCDAEYLGMNNPCPGSYAHKVFMGAQCVGHLDHE